VKNIAIVCNPLPGNDKTITVADTIALDLKKRNISFSLFTTYWPQVWDDFTDAWIIGGDGTLHYFINQYPDFHLPLSVFKSGSGNDFHWMLYGNLAIKQQVDKVLHGSVQLIDAGTCNGKLFLNGVGIGFDGAVVNDLLGRKKLAGKASYLFSILNNIFFYKESLCEIAINGQLLSQECFMISVANGKRYGGGFTVAPKADITDGLLDINIVGRIAPLKRIRYLPIIEKGKHLELSFIHYLQSEKVVIKSKKPLPAHADGEYFNASIFEIECLPKRFAFMR
jgi:YegS/Rv2252/BmrU family lipid kinase